MYLHVTVYHIIPSYNVPEQKQITFGSLVKKIYIYIYWKTLWENIFEDVMGLGEIAWNQHFHFYSQHF